MRRFLLSLLFIISYFSFSFAQQSARQFTVNLTPDGKANMVAYLPECPTGRAVVDLPGGGYTHLAVDHEGHQWAQWFNDQGIAFFVVTYRMPAGNRTIPISDAQQAIRTVRDSAAVWGVNPRDVGIMGFSAGGHLASTVSTHSEYDCRPDFSILFYPVISMNEKETHKGSCVNFLGAEGQKDEQLVKAFSNQNAVRSHLTPPAVILTASDDGAVPVLTNAIPYYTAMRRAGNNCSLYVYPSGGHGFGFRSTWAFHDQMLGDLSSWLKALPSPRQDAVRVACIGNSITHGSGIDMQEQRAYPAQLGKLLGSRYNVKNYGVGGRCMMATSDHPYMQEQAWRDVQAFLPDVVVIKLGTNDSKSYQWNQQQYERDYQAMLDTLKALPSKPTIYLCTPVKPFRDKWGITDSVIVNGVIPSILKLAKRNRLKVIDLYPVIADAHDMTSDMIHPNDKGAAKMAEAIAAAIHPQRANVVFIGNSITYGAQHEHPQLTAPPVQCARWLSAQDGIDTVYFRNCGRSGRTTYHFLPNPCDVVPAGDKTYFGDVVAKTRELVKAHPTLPLVFSIMLGTNDTVERTKNRHTEPNDYVKNLTVIIDSLLRLWPDAHVVLNKPTWYYPDYHTKGGSIATKKSLKLITTYYDMFPEVVANCKPGHVHIGDADAYGYFEKHYKTDVVEEKDARGQSYWLHPNEQGAARLAEFWGKALLPVLKGLPSIDPLKGKKIGFIGDSYVRNHREPIENTWHYKFARKHQMEYFNYGRNGNCIALDLKQWGTGMYQRYKEMRDDLDYVVVIAGHNDASQGRLDSIGIGMFKQRLGALCEGLIEKYPHAQLFFFTPWSCEGFEGSPRQQVVDAMLEVCGSYGIPVFDAARRSNIIAASEQFRKIFFQGGKGTDTAHLNARGHDRFLPVAENFILQYVEQ